jgi:hypothetical protein
VARKLAVLLHRLWVTDWGGMSVENADRRQRRGEEGCELDSEIIKMKTY